MSTPRYTERHDLLPVRDWWVPHLVLGLFVPVLAVGARVLHNHGMLLGLGHDIARGLIAAFLGVVVITLMDDYVMGRALAGDAGAQNYYLGVPFRWLGRLVVVGLVGTVAFVVLRILGDIYNAVREDFLGILVTLMLLGTVALIPLGILGFLWVCSIIGGPPQAKGDY